MKGKEMKTDLTNIDKTVRKIRKLLDNHTYQNEHLELAQITNKSKSFNLYLVGRFKSGNIYEQKHIATISLRG